MRSARTRTVFVGWVERSETHRSADCGWPMGFAALYPSYGVRLWLGGVEAVVVEDRVEHQRIAADRAATPDGVDREQRHVAAAVACVDHRRAAGHFTDRKSTRLNSSH